MWRQLWWRGGGTAKVVVAGGRGMKNGENFQLLYKVCVLCDWV